MRTVIYPTTLFIFGCLFGFIGYYITLQYELIPGMVSWYVPHGIKLVALFIPLILMATRFGGVGIMLTSMVVMSTLMGYLWQGPGEILLEYQPYLLSYALVTLLVAAVLNEKDQAQKSLEASKTSLEEQNTSLEKMTETLQVLGRNILSNQERERQFLSQELHLANIDYQVKRLDLYEAHGSVYLKLKDDGDKQHTPSTSHSGKFGLEGIHSRVAAFNGDCVISDSDGFVIEIKLPYERK
jgi:glucose-6-phosphate-specific signal transduction histidine kinase